MEQLSGKTAEESLAAVLRELAGNSVTLGHFTIMCMHVRKMKFVIC